MKIFVRKEILEGDSEAVAARDELRRSLLERDSLDRQKNLSGFVEIEVSPAPHSGEA
ncbi:MAG: hypothetical protein AB7I96_10545 [Candidatus Dadabacteria bacterium]